MPIITKIKAKGERQHKLRVITLDDEKTLTLSEETCLRFNLVVGKSLESDWIRKLEEEDGVARAKAEALRFVNYRMRTRKELVRKLSTRGWPDRVIQAVVTRLEELEMVDDARFARPRQRHGSIPARA